MIANTNERLHKLVMFFPLLFVLIPRPNIDGVQFLIYPAIAAILIHLGMQILRRQRILVDKNIVSLTSLLFLYSFSIALSILFNTDVSSFGTFIHIFKPILFFCIIYFGYVIGLNRDIDNIKKGLLKSAYVILFFQVVVGLTQLFDISIFSVIYSDFKTRPLGQLVRIAGTLANPNFFAWIVAQMIAIIYLFEVKKRNKLFWMLIGFSLLLFSGSRSLLALSPLILILISVLVSKKNVSFFIVRVPKYLLILGIVFFAAYLFITTYGNHFPYLNQLVSIINTGELTSVNSFDARTLMWDNALYKFNENSSVATWFFGLGPGHISTMDNDYLYSFINYGLISTVINIAMYVVFYFCFSKLSDTRFSALGKQYIVFAFIIGFQGETLSGWNYPLLIMFYMGLAIALLRKQEITPQ